jgi:Icc-related predicted phosphoesterase
MKILFLGDTHGQAGWVKYAIRHARDAGVETIMQVGDFGYWEHTGAGRAYLDNVQSLLGYSGVDLYWVDGNHENHTMLRATYQPDETGFVPIRGRLFYAPRGHRWIWDGVSFLALGGAYSIDKAYRQEGESWWAEELITPEEAQAASEGGHADVMVTHDVPTGVIPWDTNGGWDRKKDVFPLSAANRTLLRDVFDVVKPKLLVHGHYHNTYTAELAGCQIRGLGCDDDPTGLLIVDTEDLFAGIRPPSP